MDRPLRDQIRYLQCRLAECTDRPALHGEQMRAYQAQIALAQQADTGIDYLRQLMHSGTVMAVVRAEWIDRYRNQACIHRALGNEERVRAAEIGLEAAHDASADMDFMARVMVAQVRAAARTQAAESSERLLSSLMLGLLEWQVAPQGPAKTARATDVATIWASLRGHDPACTWARVCEYPPYRRRLPFDPPRLAWLGEQLRQVVGSETCDRAAEPPARQHAEHTNSADAGTRATGETESDIESAMEIAIAVPTAAQAAAGYRAAQQVFDRTAPYAGELAGLYERVAELERAAEDGPAFLRAMAEEDMYARLARTSQVAFAREGLARARGQGQPHAVHHFQALEQALLACQSPTEVDYEVERAQAMYAVEAAWCHILLAYATRVIAAVSRYLAEPEPAAGHVVEASHLVLGTCLGVDWDGLFAAPWIAELLQDVWFVRARTLTADAAGGLGTRAGEVGTTLVSALREAAIARIIERCAQVAAADPGHAEQRMGQIRSEPSFQTAAELRAYLDRGFIAAIGRPASHASELAGATRLVLWGREVRLDGLLESLARPARPHIAHAGGEPALS